MLDLAQATATHSGPNLVDPAAWASDFGRALDRVVARLDPRTNAELQQQALRHSDPVMREQALYEYADRAPDDAVDLLCQAVEHDSDRQVRWDALWAIEKLGGVRAMEGLQRFSKDPDPEIAEWANLFISELQTGDPVFDARPGRFSAYIL